MVTKVSKKTKKESPEETEAKKLAAQAIEISRYRNERNLMLYPFCSISKTTRFKPIKYRSSDGNRWLDVSPSVDYGMAKIWDFDILRFALSKAGEINLQLGHFPSSVTFSGYECLKALGRRTSTGKNYEWLEKALARLVSTTYRGNIFRDDTKLVSGFNLISFEYIKKQDGFVEKIKITFNDRLIESVRENKGLLAINFNVIHEESGIKKRLLELIKVSKGDNKEWIVGLERLAAMCAYEGKIKEFKRTLSSYDLPWKVKFLKKTNNSENIVFF